MANKCQIVETLKYLEDLYRQIPSNQNRKKVIGALFSTFNQNRAQIQQAASYLGVPTENTQPTPAEPVKPQPKTTPKLENTYGKFAKTIIEHVKKHNPLDIKMDANLAMRVIKNPSESFATYQVGTTKRLAHITYPDFDTVLQSGGMLQNLVTALGLKSIQEAKELVRQHQNSVDIDIVKVHEHIHAGSMAFMSQNPHDSKTVYVNNLFQKLLKKAEADPKLDNIQNGYWKTNVDEFLAVALSNTEMIKYLNDQPATGFVSMFHKLVDSLAKMLNIRMGSENEALLNIFTRMATNTVDEVIAPWDDIPTQKPVQTKTEKAAETPVLEPYNITETMKTNPGQTIAINQMKEWFTEGKGNTFLLQGRGGTGKTTVINVLLKELGVSASNVTFAAPTNKAIKVLRKANAGSSYGTSPHYTVAQLLGVKPEYDRQGNQVFKNDPYATLPSLGKVLVIDEASMLHSSNYEEVLANAAAAGTKVIFMGDNAQLPPIKDKNGPIKSVVFAENIDTSAQLTELMRQGEESPIITFTDQLIQWVNEIESKLEAKTPSHKLKNKFREELWDGNVFTKFDNQTNEGVILVSEAFEQLLPSFVRDYKENPTATKYINYNRFDHPTTLAQVNTIRQTLYGDEASKSMFLRGEPLMANGPYQYDVHSEDNKRVDNGEEFTVVSSRVVEKQIDYRVGQRVQRTKGKIKVYEIVGRNNIDGEEITFNKPVLQADVNKLISDEKKALQDKGQNPRGAFMINSVLASTLAHGYIINSHRSQGSTYDNVYMDLGNVSGQGQADINSIIKSLYVAASRPRKKLVVIDNRPNAVNQIINAQPIRQIDNAPSVKTQNKGEQADIIDRVDKCASKGR